MTMNGWTIEDAERELVYKGIRLYASIDYDEFYFRYGNQVINYGIEDENDWCFGYANVWFGEFPELIDGILAGRQKKMDGWRDTEGDWIDENTRKPFNAETFYDEDGLSEDDLLIFKCLKYEGQWIFVEIEDNKVTLECGAVEMDVRWEGDGADSLMKHGDEMIADMKAFIDYVKERGER